MRMAAEYLDLREEETGDDGERIENVDRKLASLSEAKVQRATAALKAGLDPALIAAAVAEIETEERALRARRARLEAIQHEAEVADSRTQQIQELRRSRLRRSSP